eukprot:Skav210761  [mRNA]  locus=scaffold1132:66441:66934:- [translate_table: standard]
MMLLWLAAATLAMVHGTCFQDAVPAQNLKNLVGSQGQYPIGLWNSAYPAAFVTSAVVHIVLEEVLGFNVTDTGPGPSTVEPRRAHDQVTGRTNFYAY